MEGLPKLPGNDFANRLRQKHHVPQSFKYINGYPIPVRPECGLGGERLHEDSIQFSEVSGGGNDTVLYDPILTYGRVRHLPVKPYRPHFVLYDQKTLKFSAFFRQAVPESPHETFRIRYVNILYFLEDDTLTVLEPAIENCGYPQGRLVRRGRKLKNAELGEFYCWKDLNIGIDVEMHGYVFHITDCDAYTKEFLLSNGIELNEIELLPPDPAMNERSISQRQSFRHHKMYPVPDDKLRKYLEYQGKVLHFDCVLDERDREGGELMTYKLFYYLEDDTVSIKELKENQEGRDYFPMLLRKQKLPKNWKENPVSHPSIFLEKTDHEVSEYYSPKDLIVGSTIFVYGRKFLLLDCDGFTRCYFEKALKIIQPDRVQLSASPKRSPRLKIPTYLGIGTPEDSLASHHSLVPKSPKKDVVTYLVNVNKFLRYGCVLDTAHPEDQVRRFVLSLSLADGTIGIMESSIDNSGIRGGRFLSPRKIWLPGCDPNEPDYYTAKDLYIGATIVVFSHRFKIVSADLYVYRYMQAHPEMFSSQTIESVRNYMLAEGHLREDLQQATDEAYRNMAPEGPEGEPMDEVQKRLSGFKVDGGRAGTPELVCAAGSPGPQYEKTHVCGGQAEHPCPHPTIPDEEIRKAYHTNEPEDLAIQSYRVPENYPSSPSPPRSPMLEVQGGGKKTVRFQDDC
ncbi:EF-hand domain-containing protein 1-like [Anopheles ziemanni]|uniref:EF-hand domain-containing protein 1-like n=1 Tax=Anopheles coustani TaxID=139045 RepID=UPI00265A3A32|nr:EF-hand domain-containing protein 1-like [Anopheles coustani]XP_058169689.1 EF-hand domain-containing protein 1-like [Anopheles ziemanni]